MNEIDRVPFLDTYEDEWPATGEEVARTRTPTKEEIFLSYLAFHHPFLAEDPDYLRRVNSVDVLFQENTDPSDDDVPDSSCNDIDGNSTNHKPRRKRSSQISLARSLSVDSLASPGLGSGAFCVSPTASTTTFLSRRISRSASRNPAPPAESPTKRAFPRPHSPIVEHVDYPMVLDPPQSGIIVIPKGGKKVDDSQSHIKAPPLTSLVSNPAPPTEPHPVSLPPQPPVHVPTPQVSVSPSSSSSPSVPPYQGQSSGETYEHLYDSDPSRSNSADSNTASKLNSGNKKSNGVQHQTKTDGKHEPQPEAAQVGTPKWVVPVAIVTVGVALIAGYYYFRRRS